jgi:dienelactone hydrolase
MTGRHGAHSRRGRALAALILVAVAGAVLLGVFARFGAEVDAAATRGAPARLWRSRPPTTRRARPTIRTPTTAAPGPPYAVANTHVLVSRTDSTGLRTLPVSIHYPVSGSPGGAETSDATAARGRFPLVLFAHGWNGSADFYADMDREIAAAGFIVAAPSFPHTSSATGPLNRGDVVNQPADLAFLIDQFTTTPPAVLADHIAPTKVGVVGHSDGGVTAAGIAFNTCCADPRVGAAAVLSGAELFFDGSWFPPGSPPLLAVHGASDEVNPFGVSQRLFDDAPSPKYLVRAPGGHIPPFTSDPMVRPAVSTLVADFLRAELTGDSQARNRIPTDANTNGLELVESG